MLWDCGPSVLSMMVGLGVSGWPGRGHPALRRAFGVGVGQCLLLLQEEGATEDEMAGWHHQLDGHESE